MSYTVVGGGISGLAAAHYLRKLPQTKSVTVLESAARLGGWVETSRYGSGIFSLKHESSIFRSFIQPCKWFWKSQANSPWAHSTV